MKECAPNQQHVHLDQSAQLPAIPAATSSLPAALHEVSTLAHSRFSDTSRPQALVDPIAFSYNFIDMVEKRGDVSTLLNLARQTSVETISDLAQSVEQKQDQEQQLIAQGLSTLNENQIRASLDALSGAERQKAEEIFTQMIGDIRQQTTYLAALEHSKIASALERGSLYGQQYPSWLVYREASDRFEGGGRYLPGFNLIILTVNTKDGNPKDTVVTCWSKLAATGCLPDEVETLRHELHHAEQHKTNLFYRVLDLMPNLRIFPLSLLHLQPGVCETTAHLLPQLEPHIKAWRDTSGVARSLCHPEFSTYRYVSECSSEMVETTHRLILLGTTEKDLAVLVGKSRFRGYNGAMSLLRREEAKRRGEQKLTNDEEYAITLALRHADRHIESSIQRWKAQAIAQQALKRLSDLVSTGPAPLFKP